MSTAATSHRDAHAHGPIEWPEERYMGRASALKLGMWIFLLSDAFSFGGLLLAYGILRGGAEVWWPAGEPDFGINFTAVLTFLLICSSVTMVLAVANAKEGNRPRTLAYLALTILGGLLFLAGQYAEYWGILEPGLLKRGLHFGESARATTFYLITSFHGLHVFTGVLLLCMTLVKAARRLDHDLIESIGLFWHFVDLVWILVFTFVYLIPGQPGT